MHECPFCGEECYCDMDDCGGLPVPDDCPHVCADPDDMDDDMEDDMSGDGIMDAPEMAVIAEFFNQRVKMAQEIILLRKKYSDANGIIEAYSATIAEYARAHQELVRQNAEVRQERAIYGDVTARKIEELEAALGIAKAMATAFFENGMAKP